MRLYVLDLWRPIDFDSVEELLTTSFAETLQWSESSTSSPRDESNTRPAHDKTDKPEGKVGQIRVPLLSRAEAVEKDIGS